MLAARIAFVMAFSLLGCVIQAREIPLTDFVATVRQKDLQYIGSGRRLVEGKTQVEDYASAMQDLTLNHSGASNAVLVDAANVSEAVKASARILAGYRPADRPSPSSNQVTGNYWFVVYLGSGHSSPRKWTVEGVSIDEKRIRLTYRKPKAGFQTMDIVRYYYWIPLGQLDDGAYNLELYDANLAAVTLMRRVEIKSK